MPALVNTGSNLPQGAPAAEMAVQFSNNEEPQVEKRFLGCLLDKLCPHQGSSCDEGSSEDSCEDDSGGGGDSCSDSCGSDSCSGSGSGGDDSCSSSGGGDDSSSSSSDSCCENPPSHSGSDCPSPSSSSSSSSGCSSDCSGCGGSGCPPSSSSSSGSDCGGGCEDSTKCIHKKRELDATEQFVKRTVAEVAPPTHNGSEMISDAAGALDKRGASVKKTNAAGSNIRIPKTLFGVATLAAVGTAAVMSA